MRGKLFDMGNYPAGVAINEDHFIVGELYRIINENEFPWAIGQLDDYEGVSVEHGEVRLYYREVAEVQLNGELTQAWIYWFNGDTSGKPEIASGDLMEYLNKTK